MKIGLFFGSFNPIHVGHLIISNHIVQHTDLEKIWLVVSPHNPHKEKKSLLEDYHRRTLVQLAIEDNDLLEVCDIEFKLPKPSYTVTTLQKLKELYPKHEFVLIMGEDNLQSLQKWYNYEYLVENYKIIVYPRIYNDKSTIPQEFITHPNISICKDVPIMEISSSNIRKDIKKGKNVAYMLTPPVLKYIDEMNFYR